MKKKVLKFENLERRQAPFHVYETYTPEYMRLGVEPVSISFEEKQLFNKEFEAQKRRDMQTKNIRQPVKNASAQVGIIDSLTQESQYYAESLAKAPIPEIQDLSPQELKVPEKPSLSQEPKQQLQLVEVDEQECFLPTSLQKEEDQYLIFIKDGAQFRFWTSAAEDKVAGVIEEVLFDGKSDLDINDFLILKKVVIHVGVSLV